MIDTYIIHMTAHLNNRAASVLPTYIHKSVAWLV